MKKQIRAFEKLQVDVKHLDDIPELYKEYIHHPLSNYQFTARCVRTGGVCFAYAREKSMTNTTLFLLHLYKHLSAQGVVKCLGAKHHLIPPGANTFQSDVESFHRWVEEELYAAEPFGSKQLFLKKVAYYQAWFNFKRQNRYNWDTPLNLARQVYLQWKAEALVWIPVVLDNLLVQQKDELAQWAA
ncbi:MAG: hypothetical protein Kow009_04300 [Spirochaetales bacterium]